jgi:hypothetical protein
MDVRERLYGDVASVGWLLFREVGFLQGERGPPWAQGLQGRKLEEKAMTNITRSIRRYAIATLAGLALTCSATGVAVLAGSSAAHATANFYVWPLDQKPSDHLVGIANYGYDSRNVEISTDGGTPNGQVWIGVQDTVSKVWYGASGPVPGTWPTSDSNGRITAAKITGIPRSSCGHQFLVAATDIQTGIGDTSTLGFIDDCTPALALQYGHIVKGDGFTPGGTVYVYRNGSFWKSVTATVFQLHRSPRLPTPQGTISPGDAGTGCLRVDAYDLRSQTWVSPFPGYTTNDHSEFPAC